VVAYAVCDPSANRATHQGAATDLGIGRVFLDSFNAMCAI
jgi:hypothetical protein